MAQKAKSTHRAPKSTLMQLQSQLQFILVTSSLFTHSPTSTSNALSMPSDSPVARISSICSVRILSFLLLHQCQIAHICITIHHPALSNTVLPCRFAHRDLCVLADPSTSVVMVCFRERARISFRYRVAPFGLPNSLQSQSCSSCVPSRGAPRHLLTRGSTSFALSCTSFISSPSSL